MAYYQNILTQVQIRPIEAEHGVPVAVDSRWGKPFH
ncbi:MAG: photosynthetic reaction center subunit M, partial [Methylobacterium sp.]